MNLVATRIAPTRRTTTKSGTTFVFSTKKIFPHCQDVKLSSQKIKFIG